MTDPTLTDVYEALAGDICWCQRTPGGQAAVTRSTTNDVMLALAGIEICEVCNNGVSREGWWFPEVANGSKHHDTSTHSDDKEPVRPRWIDRDVWANTSGGYARCFTCGEAVSGPKPSPDSGRPFWRGHVCQHTCALGDGGTP